MEDQEALVKAGNIERQRLLDIEDEQRKLSEEAELNE